MIPTRIIAIGITATILLSGCATQHEPPYLKNIDETISQGAALIARRHGYSMSELALVTTVDGEHIVLYPNLLDVITDPILLSPGRHIIEIKFMREFWICGYFGCPYFTQATRSLELSAEPGHFYHALATKRCGKDWIWIEDNGMKVKDFLEARQKKTERHINFIALHVVAGEVPPTSCDTNRNNND